MNAVAAAIANGRHFSKRSYLEPQTWEHFKEMIPGKKIFLFGMGNGAEYYFEHYAEIPLEGVIDHNRSKQGFKANQFILSAMADAYKNLDIFDITVLDSYHPEDIVILITCLKSYEEIMDEMELRGIRHNYVLLLMEAKRLEGHAIVSQESYERYVREYCRREIEEKKIVFYNQNGYCGHGKYITEELLRQRKDLDIVWLVKDLTLEVPDGVRLVYSLNYRNFIFELETAKAWVFDYWVPVYIEKRPEQIYFQVKHWAGVTLKTFGLDDAVFQKYSPHIFCSLYNGKIIDYIIVGSRFDEESCRRGFVFDGEVYYAGSPRSDILFRPGNARKKVCHYCGIEETVRLLVYAPTFRTVEHVSAIGDIALDFAQLRKTLRDKFGGIWYILLRIHPYVAEKSDKVQRSECVIDVSRYSDSQELVAASDILLTDYSSIMFEPAFVKKPVFLFAPDRKEYIDGNRKLLMEYDSLPFSISETNEELAQNIAAFNPERYRDKIERFLERYEVHEDGHASERAADFICEKIEHTI